MNINTIPTLSQLKTLFASADDEAGHHVLWVGADGAVHLDALPDDVNPVSFEESKPSMRARFETFAQGSGYVGPEAAEDDAWMNRLLRKLSSIELTEKSQYFDHY